MHTVYNIVHIAKITTAMVQNYGSYRCLLCIALGELTRKRPKPTCEMKQFIYALKFRFFVRRHKFGRLLQEHGVGPARGQGPKVREILSVLFGTLPGHKVQHHDPPQDAVLHHQPHPAVRRHLLGDSAAVLHAGQLRRKDHDEHDRAHVAQHLPAADRRDQPVDVAGDAAHRQISPFHDGARGLLHSDDCARSESAHARRQHARDGAVGRRSISSSSSAAAVHAATAGPHSTWQQILEGESLMFTFIVFVVAYHATNADRCDGRVKNIFSKYIAERPILRCFETLIISIVALVYITGSQPGSKLPRFGNGAF